MALNEPIGTGQESSLTSVCVGELAAGLTSLATSHAQIRALKWPTSTSTPLMNCWSSGASEGAGCPDPKPQDLHDTGPEEES